MTRAAFVYGDDLARRDSRADEIFGPTRLQYTYELLGSYGAFSKPESSVVRPTDASRADLLSFHTAEYVNAVKDLSDGKKRPDARRFNFSETGDNPPYPGMYELSTLVAGASLCAAELVAGGDVDVAFNCAGGQHHAAADHASGFCIFNDVVIAIKRLLEKGLRVAYVDIDAHHGDGVQNAFYDTDRVLTISLHETGRLLFPGTGEPSEIGVGEGEGYCVNLPLAPRTGDDVYLWAFDEIVPPLVHAFKPDVLVTQLGCDAHYLDPMTQLSLTTRGYDAILHRLRGLSPRWLALGGGGYELSVVVRIWTMDYGVMLGEEWPDEIPADFRELYGLKVLRDADSPRIARHAGENARRFAENSVAEVKRLVFPRHGL